MRNVRLGPGLLISAQKQSADADPNRSGLENNGRGPKELLSRSYETETVDRKFHATMNFWRRILEDRALRGLDDLAKLIIGCEIIVALDDVSLLST